MEQSVATLTGWLHSPDELTPLASVFGKVKPYDYGVYDSYKALPEAQADMVIGWSMGAQLAMRLVADGRLKTQRLVLLAPHVQFVKTAQFLFGNKAAQVDDFLSTFERDAEAGQALFKQWLGKDDAEFYRVKENHANWMQWGREMQRFSGTTLDFFGFPHTDIFHGKEDRVVSSKQSEWLTGNIPGAKLHLIEGAGHVLHRRFIQQIIEALH